ncbi:MAG TPA: ankyrin repeat domain-containing protein [Abditibacteriaceae bacterium]|jgi:ankyrin repeat protein
MRRFRIELILACLIICGLFGWLRVEMGKARTRHLAVAVRQGDVQTARWLIQRGADVNGRDEDGDLILMAAVRFLNTDMVRLLEKHGAKTDDVTRFMIAAFLNRADVVQTMLQNGLNPNVKDRDGDTALSCAAQQGNVETVKVLLQYGTNPKIINQNGMTVLDWVMQCQNPLKQKEIIALLKARGVPINGPIIPRRRGYRFQGGP